MLSYSLRFLKRFLVLIPGVIITVVSVRDIYPFFKRRLPVGLAIFLTYILAAYILIPALIRIIRIIKPVKHLPLYCVTPDGFASDPLNIAIICTRTQLIKAMETSGWYVADPMNFKNIIRQIVSTVLSWSYPSAPISNLYLFGRKQDIAFEIPIEGSGSGSRHHVRFWATTYNKDRQRLSVDSISWTHRRTYIEDSKLLWVGAASLDVGIAPIRHNFQITHMIDPDTNGERDLIINQLKNEKLISKKDIIKLGNPYRLVNRALGGYLKTDGKMHIIHLRQ